MRRNLLILMLGLVFATPIRGEDFMLGGIQINEPDQDAWAQTLVDNGFNTMQITIYARQGVWDSDDLHVDPVDEGTVKKIRAAHAAGLRVAMILRIDLDHAHPENRFLWHGLILPSPENLHPWFDRYAQFVRQWAEVCEREGVELLGLGSEVNAATATRPTAILPTLENYYLDTPQQDQRREEMVASAESVPGELIRAPGDASPVDNFRVFVTDRDRALHNWAAAVSFDTPGRTEAERIALINHRRAELLSRWQGLIAEVRSRYSGDLTYAANFDSYAEVGFWPELDVMAVNAYFPLREPTEAADADTLAAGWERVFTDLEASQADMGVAGMPVIFTELGYTRRAGATTAPWAWQGFDLVGESKTLMVWETLPFDPDERVRAMEALRRVNENHSQMLAGLLYWKLTSKPYHAEIEPFSLLLHDGPDHAEADPLQSALLRFLEPSRADADAQAAVPPKLPRTPAGGTAYSGGVKSSQR